MIRKLTLISFLFVFTIACSWWTKTEKATEPTAKTSESITLILEDNYAIIDSKTPYFEETKIIISVSSEEIATYLVNKILLKDLETVLAENRGATAKFHATFKPYSHYLRLSRIEILFPGEKMITIWEDKGAAE